MIWRSFYNVVVVPLLWTIFHLIALFDHKAARAFQGRRNLFDKLGRFEVEKAEAEAGVR